MMTSRVGLEARHLEVDPDQMVCAGHMSVRRRDMWLSVQFTRGSLSPPDDPDLLTNDTFEARVTATFGRHLLVRNASGQELRARPFGRGLTVVCGDNVRCRIDPHHDEVHVLEVIPRRTRAVSIQSARTDRAGGRKPHATAGGACARAGAGSVRRRPLPGGGRLGGHRRNAGRQQDGIGHRCDELRAQLEVFDASRAIRGLPARCAAKRGWTAFWMRAPDRSPRWSGSRVLGNPRSSSGSFQTPKLKRGAGAGGGRTAHHHGFADCSTCRAAAT